MSSACRATTSSPSSADGEEPAHRHQHLRRAGRRLRRRRLCARQGHGRGLRHLLRRRPQGRQRHRRGLRREVARRDDQRRAGHARAACTTRCCTTWCATSTRSYEVFEKLMRRRRRARRSGDRLREIDRVLAPPAGRAGRSISRCRATWRRPSRPRRRAARSPAETSDPDALARGRRRKRPSDRSDASHPVIIAGVEMHRFGLQDALARPRPEVRHPGGRDDPRQVRLPRSRPALHRPLRGRDGPREVRDYVEASDCVVLLGTIMTDINLGIYTARIDRRTASTPPATASPSATMPMTTCAWRISSRGLAAHDWPKRDAGALRASGASGAARRDRRADDASRRCSASSTHSSRTTMVVIADPGDALFGADGALHPRRRPVPGAGLLLLAGLCRAGRARRPVARPDSRPLVLVGDGAFQMTGMELGDDRPLRLNPIVIVLDNDGYGTERPMLDGAFNDVHRWNYCAHPRCARRRPRHAGRDRANGGGANAGPRQQGRFTLIQAMLAEGRPLAGCYG